MDPLLFWRKVYLLPLWLFTLPLRLATCRRRTQGMRPFSLNWWAHGATSLAIEITAVLWLVIVTAVLVGCFVKDQSL